MFDIFGNGTIAPPVNWQPDASTRGTTDILSTCLITLGLCLWSALHLNIPQHGKSSRQKWYKCGWLVLGLLAPEMVAFAAWVQLRAARRLDKRMKRLLGEAPSPSHRDKFWRLLHAGKDGRCKSTSGRDEEEGKYTEQHNESQTDEKNVGSRQFNVAGGNQPPGTASYETRPRAEDGPEASHDSVTMDPKLTSSNIAFVGNRHRLVDQDRDDESCVSYGSETRHQTTVDEADTELHEEYGHSSHRQPESAEPTTLPDGKRSLQKRRHPWTMTHSFYAIMGGFAFDTSDAKPNFLPNHRSRLCISANGLEYIAEKAPELIPDIAEKHIKDKSKADSLAKFLVCLQALWFCVQCMTRVIQRKAISLLELNTFAHAFCALLIYALWWHKPQDVEEPTLLQGEKEWEMCAFLCMSCRQGDRAPEVRGGLPFGEPMGNGDYPPMMMQWHNTAATESVSALNRIINPITDSSSSEKDPYRKNSPGEGPAVMLTHGQSVYGFQCNYQDWNRVSRPMHETLRIEPPHLRRLELHWNATKTFNIKPCYSHVSEAAVCDSMPHWPLTLTLDELNPLLVRSNRLGDIGGSITPELLGLILSGLLYGGLHLLAWKMPFASRAECILWRFSGIFIISTGLGFTGLQAFIKAYEESATNYNANEDLRVLAYVLLLVFAFLFSCTLCVGYFFARTFLVVECFLQLSRLPPSAYETPAWSAYFPHIS